MSRNEMAYDAFRESLVALWNACDDHSIVMGGEHVVDGYEHFDGNPPAPRDDNELVRLVTKYLKETI